MKLVFKTKEEWLEARKGKITSTMASAILGLNPYFTSQDAWEYLVGLKTPSDISDRPQVKYGLEAEKHIRNLFALNHPEYEVEDIKDGEWHLYVDDEFPFICASGDGIYTKKVDGTKGSLEIKTSEILSSQHKENWKQSIPSNYFCQVLLEIRCQQTNEATLVAELKYASDYIARKEYEIKKEDVQDDIDYIVKGVVDFYNKYVVTKKRPPLVLDI